MLKDWLAEREIKAQFAALAHQLANGKVESFNKIMSNGIKGKLDNAKGRVEEL